MAIFQTRGGGTAAEASRTTAPLLTVENLTKRFPLSNGFLGRQRRVVHAVENLSFTVGRGETLGLVGESGCGKSTVGKTILKLHEPTEGSNRLNGREIAPLRPAAMRPFRKQMQIIFQDPLSSLTLRMSDRQSTRL